MWNNYFFTIILNLFAEYPQANRLVFNERLNFFQITYICDVIKYAMITTVVQ